MDVDAPARTQSRLAVRLLGEMRLTALIRSIDTVRRISGASFVFDRGVLFVAILRASAGIVGNWPPDLSNRQAADAGGISINALSHSMRRPFETVRRHVNALIAAGLCTRTDQGVVVAAVIGDDPEVRALLAHLHDSLVWLIEQFRFYGVPLPRSAAGADYRSDIVLASSIDFALAAFENVGVHFEDWLELAVVSAVAVASARTITLDPVLARTWAGPDAVPPADLRRAVTAAAIARGLNIPYSTVRRQTLATIGKGLLEKRGDGVIVAEALIGGETAAMAGAVALGRASALFGRLVAAGFPFDDPRSAYIAGPPALVAFD